MAASDIGPRSFSSVALAAVILGALLAGWSIAYAIIIPLIGGLALWEFYLILAHRGIASFKIIGTVCGVLFLLANWAILGGAVPNIDHALFECICLLALLLGLLTRQVFDRSLASPVLAMAGTLLGVLYVAWLFNFVTRLIYFPPAAENGRFLAVFVIVVTKMTDIGAYLVGSRLGRHKMMPSVSPKKTWEGFAGGILAAAASGFLLVHLFPAQLSLISPAWIGCATGAFIALVSVIGDLAESVVKRDAQIKDSGRLIPGIGGVLDLIDSLLFTAPIFYICLSLLHKS